MYVEQCGRLERAELEFGGEAELMHAIERVLAQLIARGKAARPAIAPGQDGSFADFPAIRRGYGRRLTRLRGAQSPFACQWAQPPLDFTNPDRQRRLAEAHALISDAYHILCDQVGVENPADNQFLREATICARIGLVWTGQRGGIDALDPEGQGVEIKTTRLDAKRGVKFPTSRYVSQTVIDRFRDAAWWIFGVFSRYEELVALYRVEAERMEPTVAELEQRMKEREAAGRPLENNPKISLSMIRAAAQRPYLDARYRERDDPQRGPIIELRSE